MKKDTRHFKVFTRLDRVDCSAEAWGKASRSWDFLPEAQNDMIFSIVCEELGLVGAGLIILLFLILIWRFFVIAVHAKDLLGALIASGAMAHDDHTGDLKHCGRDKFDPKYRNHFAVYQLRRNIRLVFASGNGTCAQCIKIW